jgi:hypothetical protein
MAEDFAAAARTAWDDARPGDQAPAETHPAVPSADQVADHYAIHLSDTSASAFMYFSLAGVFRQADALAYKKYRDKLLIDCGSPTDPIEIMMVEQLALAHLNTGRLHFKAATADSLEAARTYGALAIALAGEFRRGALALKSYRTRPPAGVESVTSAEAAAPRARASGEGIDGELGSNLGGDHDGGTIPLPESAEGRGGPEEPGQAERVKRRRA